MKSRRTHTKSRNGCEQCKKRRVKCDEQTPSCASCNVRGISCIYPYPKQSPRSRNSKPELVYLAPVSTEALSVSPPPPRQSPVVSQTLAPILGLLAEAPPPPVQPPPRQYPVLLSQSVAPPRPQPSTRMYELELMNHYSTNTCYTFALAAVDYTAWRTFTVREAMRYEFLMDGVLGLTAFHVASEGPRDAAAYSRIGFQYQARALEGFQQALEYLSPDNCNAMFAFSDIVMMSAIASSRFTEELRSPMDNILLLLDHLDGIRLVTDRGRQWITSGPFAAVLNLWTSPGSFIHDQNIRTALNQLKAFNESTKTARNNSQHAVFLNAIAQLETCFSRDKEMVIIWLAMAGNEFMVELRNREPMAMLIFMHWSVLLGRLRNEWWVDECGRRLVQELSIRLRVYGPSWEAATFWAEKEVGLLS